MPTPVDSTSPAPAPAADANPEAAMDYLVMNGLLLQMLKKPESDEDDGAVTYGEVNKAIASSIARDMTGFGA